MAYRVEHDFLGAVRVPSHAYYGAFTVRATHTFQISSYRAPPFFLKSLLLAKKACALANEELGVLDPKKARAIVRAVDEALPGKYDDQFVLDAFQAGAGTPYNMNANEVLANRATELLGGKKGQYLVHPNNDVNASQSSNDVIPTATRLACVQAHEKLDAELTGLAKAFEKKAKAFANVIKVGRTHLQDAVPMTLGQELRSYASAMERSQKKSKHAAEALLEVPLGGTALGTGINTPPGFDQVVCQKLSDLSGFSIRPAEDKVELEQDHNDFLHAAQALSLLSVNLIRITNNLKLLASGPKAGLAEIVLPEVEPGSSIMPGKVNPSVCEAVEMVGMHCIGSTHAVELACVNAQLDLNTNTPLIAFELLNSFSLLTKACRLFAQHVQGIRANEKRAQEMLEQTTACATALNPVLGYSTVSKLVQQALREKKPLRQVVLEKKLLAPKKLDELLSPENLTQPNLKKK